MHVEFAGIPTVFHTGTSRKQPRADTRASRKIRRCHAWANPVSTRVRRRNGGGAKRSETGRSALSFSKCFGGDGSLEPGHAKVKRKGHTRTHSCWSRPCTPGSSRFCRVRLPTSHLPKHSTSERVRNVGVLGGLVKPLEAITNTTTTRAHRQPSPRYGRRKTRWRWGRLLDLFPRREWW